MSSKQNKFNKFRQISEITMIQNMQVPALKELLKSKNIKLSKNGKALTKMQMQDKLINKILQAQWEINKKTPEEYEIELFLQSTKSKYIDKIDDTAQNKEIDRLIKKIEKKLKKVPSKQESLKDLIDTIKSKKIEKIDTADNNEIKCLINKIDSKLKDKQNIKKADEFREKQLMKKGFNSLKVEKPVKTNNKETLKLKKWKMKNKDILDKINISFEFLSKKNLPSELEKEIQKLFEEYEVLQSTGNDDIILLKKALDDFLYNLQIQESKESAKRRTRISPSKQAIKNEEDVTFDINTFKDVPNFELIEYKKKHYLRDLETNIIFSIKNNKPYERAGLYNVVKNKIKLD